MELNFSSEEYKAKALNTKSAKRETSKAAGEAFFLLINQVSQDDLSNFCEEIKIYFETKENPVLLSIEDSYKLTQGNNVKEIVVDDVLKEKILELAYKCLEKGKHLGEKTINDGKINTSSWISHALYEGKLTEELALKLGLDAKAAKIQGILHDFGRKKDHSLGHVIKGYEMLIDAGWESEAIGSLTHSFLNGGRCANNEQAEQGFFVDEKGNPCWEENAPKDDIALFLDTYEFDMYDIILNVADLMATDKGIVSPFDRISDIATRRTIDPTNRGYFLAEFNNKLIDMLVQMGANIPNMPEKIYATPDVTLEEINERFRSVSEVFFEYYKSQIEKKKPVVTSKDIASAATKEKLTSTQLGDAADCTTKLIEDKDKKIDE